MIGQIRYINNFGSKQIRGEERESLAKQCILDSNGSANAFVNEIISSHVLAGECVPDDLNLKSKRFKDVVRKCFFFSDHVISKKYSNKCFAKIKK